MNHINDYLSTDIAHNTKAMHDLCKLFTRWRLDPIPANFARYQDAIASLMRIARESNPEASKKYAASKSEMAIAYTPRNKNILKRKIA